MRDLPDHVAIELEFLYQLLFAQNHLLSPDKPDQNHANTRLTQRLLQEHLGAWIEPFAQAVAQNARTVFYRQLSSLTLHFVRRMKEDNPL